MRRKWSLFIAVIAAALLYGLPPGERAAVPTAPPPAPLPAPVLYPSAPAPEATSGQLVRRETVVMGSPFVFVVDAPEQRAVAALTAIAARLRELEAQISSWRPGSDVYRLNDNPGRFIRVGPDTLELLRLGQRLYAETGGAFDIGIGALWDLYPFRDPDAPLPDEGRIRAALALTGADRIRIDAAASRALVPAGMRINLGGIGKGYAARIAIEALREMGIANAAVSAGGDVYLMGGKSDGPWNVRIENPRWEGRTIEQFNLRDLSVATSGDGRRYVVRDGRRYGHILDPRTGRPAEGAQSVTVIGTDPTLADAYATALFVMGPAEGLRWANAHPGIEALIVDHDGRVLRSDGWRAVTGGGA